MINTIKLYQLICLASKVKHQTILEVKRSRKAVDKLIPPLKAADSVPQKHLRNETYVRFINHFIYIIVYNKRLKWVSYQPITLTWNNSYFHITEKNKQIPCPWGILYVAKSILQELGIFIFPSPEDMLLWHFVGLDLSFKRWLA